MLIRPQVCCRRPLSGGYRLTELSCTTDVVKLRKLHHGEQRPLSKVTATGGAGTEPLTSGLG